MASFLVALASNASRCGFHVKRVSRVTPRNVGVSTCGTGWLFHLSETFSFAVDSVKSVLTILVVLSCSAQLSVQLHTSLMVFWIRWTAVVVCSSVHLTAKSSACRVFDTSWHCGCDVIYVNQEESRRYNTTLGNTLSQLDLSADRPI